MSIRVLKKPRTGRILTPRIAALLVVAAAAAGFAGVPGLLSGAGAVIPKGNTELAGTLLRLSLPGEGADNKEQGRIFSGVLGYVFPIGAQTQPENIPEDTVSVPEEPAALLELEDQPHTAEEIWPEPPPSRVTDVMDEPDAPPEGSMDLMSVTFSPVSDAGYDTGGSVFINNQTSIDVDIDGLMHRELSLKLTAGKPQVLIIHTHGSESFFPDERDYYVPTDIERTEDTRYNVVRLGDELTGILEQKGLSVIHDRSIYDYPTYNGAYTRTLESITKIIKNNPTIQIVIDIHRDSIITAAGTLYKTISEVEDENTAQMMFVIGTNNSGLTHPDFKENLAMAVQLQEKLNSEYPSLMRPINLRKERFNQHATHGSMILEVGTSGNTLEEALAAIRRFGQSAGDFWKAYIDG